MFDLIILGLALATTFLLIFAIVSGAYKMPEPAGNHRWILFSALIAFNILVVIASLGILDSAGLRVIRTFIIGAELFAIISVLLLSRPRGA